MKTRTIGSVVGVAALAVVAAASPVHSQTIETHTENQERRIENGEESGKLTPKESTRLQNEQQTIHDERQRAAADGKVTQGERHEIRHDQRAANRDIHRKKNNAKQD
jgi:hypothetical protein